MSFEPVVIPVPSNSDEAPFNIGDNLTVFEAAMVYAGRHPCPVFLRDGSLEDHQNWLRAGVREEEPRARCRARARRSWDIYCDLRKRIASGKIVPIKSAYLRGGEIDPIRTFIRTSDLVDLATERGERPGYLMPFLSNVVASERGGPATQQRDKTEVRPQSRRRGPAPGTVSRYGEKDGALFSEIDRLMRDSHLSVHGAALELARAGKIAGAGTMDSRAKRLSERYRGEGRRDRA